MFLKTELVEGKEEKMTWDFEVSMKKISILAWLVLKFGEEEKVFQTEEK